MTPQEQQLVADLFDRLATLEGQRRDPDAERVIREGLGHAPNAVYALVQTVLVQDEALKRANARIEELERAAKEPAPAGGAGGGFLDSMRAALTGRDQRGSVPTVRPGGQGSSGVWGGGPRPQAAPAAPPAAPSAGGQFGGYPGGPMGGGGMGGGMMGGGGSSFLGTAAATVAGVVGGGMLLNGIRSMMGGGGHQAFGDYAGKSPGSSPWDSGGDRGSGDLARDAGLGDIGGGHPSAAHDDSSRAGAFDNPNEQHQDDVQDEDQYDAQDDGQSDDGADDDYAGGFDSGDDFDTA